jgi:hypothetical protein
MHTELSSPVSQKHTRMEKYDDRIVWALQVWTGPFWETADYLLEYTLCAEGNVGYVEGEGNKTSRK